jgi:hypothetical protein
MASLQAKTPISRYGRHQRGNQPTIGSRAVLTSCFCLFTLAIEMWKKKPSIAKPGKNRRRPVFIGAVFACIGLAAGLIPGEEVVLVGPLLLDQVLKAVPEWRQLRDAYEPNLRAVDSARYFSKPVQIRVFLGTWDPECGEPFGALFRTLELADNPSIKVELIGVSKDLKSPAGKIGSKALRKLPTIIITVSGEEKGRIIGSPQVSIEEDLAAILLEYPVSPTDQDFDKEYFRVTPHSHLAINCAPCHVTIPPRSVLRPALHFSK